MPTGDAYSSGHLFPFPWDLHMFYLLRPILFRNCRYFTELCSSNFPRYFLDFALYTAISLLQYAITCINTVKKKIKLSTNFQDCAVVKTHHKGAEVDVKTIQVEDGEHADNRVKVSQSVEGCRLPHYETRGLFADIQCVCATQRRLQ